MVFSAKGAYPGTSHKRAQAISFAWIAASGIVEKSRKIFKTHQARQIAYFSTQFCHAPFAGKLWYSYNPDNAGTLWCENDDDLYALRTEQNSKGSKKSTGFLNSWYHKKKKEQARLLLLSLSTQIWVLAGRIRPANNLLALQRKSYAQLLKANIWNTRETDASCSSLPQWSYFSKTSRMAQRYYWVFLRAVQSHE